MKNNSNYSTIVVLMLALLILYRIYDRQAFLVAAFGLGVVTLLIPRSAVFIHDYWMKFGQVIGAVTNKVLLTLIFFLILLPFSYLSRSFKKISLITRRKEQSYYQDRNHEFIKADLENMW